MGSGKSGTSGSVRAAMSNRALYSVIAEINGERVCINPDSGLMTLKNAKELIASRMRTDWIRGDRYWIVKVGCSSRSDSAILIERKEVEYA